jgi:hypothetical protein
MQAGELCLRRKTGWAVLTARECLVSRAFNFSFVGQGEVKVLNWTTRSHGVLLLPRESGTLDF